MKTITTDTAQPTLGEQLATDETDLNSVKTKIADLKRARAEQQIAEAGWTAEEGP